MHRIWALIWREAHKNRGILRAGGVLFLLPYIVLVVAFWRAGSSVDVRLSVQLAEFANTGGYFSIFLSQLTLVMLSCSAFVRDRVDGSIEFLGYLPLSKLQIAAAKASFLLAASMFMWFVNLMGMLSAEMVFERGHTAIIAELPRLQSVCAVGFSMAGGGWLMSAYVSDTVSPLVAAVLMPLLGLALLGGSRYLYSVPAYTTFVDTFMITCIVLGDIGFGVGTVLYLRVTEE